MHCELLWWIDRLSSKWLLWRQGTVAMVIAVVKEASQLLALTHEGIIICGMQIYNMLFVTSFVTKTPYLIPNMLLRFRNKFRNKTSQRITNAHKLNIFLYLKICFLGLRSFKTDLQQLNHYQLVLSFFCN